jgi:hypothetical protein
MHCGNCEQKVNTVPACGWPNQRLRCCTNCHAHTYYTEALPKPPDEPLRLDTPNIATQPIIDYSERRHDRMKFSVYKIADVGTEYLESDDLNLLETAPCHLAEITFKAGGVEDNTGSIFYVPEDPRYLAEDIQKMQAHGLSERFIAIMQELHQQGIPYVRFDRDGQDIDGIDPCDHELF